MLRKAGVDGLVRLMLADAFAGSVRAARRGS
jgi:hypothetical protein